MPRNRRTTQAQPQRILPTTEQMFDQYWSQVPVIHQETSDDWQPAFDQGAQSGFGSQINPPTQPAPAAAVVTPQVSATTVDAPVAQAPQEADTGLRRMQAERRMLDEMNGVTPTPVDAEWSDSQRNMVSQIGNYGNTSEASVADALSQVAADGGRDANAAELSGVDYLDSNQDMERAAVSGQLDSDKGKQESFGLVGAEKEEDKPLTEQDYLRQAQEDTSVGRTIQGIFAALGMLGGSDTWVRENRNIADDINAQPMKLYNQRRAVRENQRIANKQRSDIRQQTEAQLGAQKEAAQLADPTSNQSRRLQGMYSVRLSMAVPGMSASDIQSYLGELPYSDEASRQALDSFLEAAEKARSEGRALQHEEAMRHLENIKSFINVNTSALARMDSARSRGGGGGGGNLQSQIDELTRHKINVWMGANNISDPPQSVVDSFRAQATQELSNRSPRARQAWLNQQGAGADQDVRAAGQDDRTVRPEIAAANAEEAMQMFDALPEDRRKAVIRQLALINSSADSGLIAGALRSGASMALVPNEQDRATASTIQRLLTATVKDNSGAAVSGNEIIRNLSGGGVDVLASNPQGFRDALQEYHSMAQGQINRRGTRAPVIDPSTLQVQEGRPRAGGVRVFVKNGVERRSSDPENIRMLQGLGYTEVTQ